MAKHPHGDHADHKHEAPADVQKAAALVSELAADCCAKKDAVKPLHVAFEKAEQEAADAEVKLRDAEEALLKAARQHKPEPEKPE